MFVVVIEEPELPGFTKLQLKGLYLFEIAVQIPVVILGLATDFLLGLLVVVVDVVDIEIGVVYDYSLIESAGIDSGKVVINGGRLHSGLAVLFTLHAIIIIQW